VEVFKRRNSTAACLTTRMRSKNADLSPQEVFNCRAVIPGAEVSDTFRRAEFSNLSDRSDKLAIFAKGSRQAAPLGSLTGSVTPLGSRGAWCLPLCGGFGGRRSPPSADGPTCHARETNQAER
jgi:hypothetical protein